MTEHELSNTQKIIQNDVIQNSRNAAGFGAALQNYQNALKKHQQADDAIVNDAKKRLGVINGGLSREDITITVEGPDDFQQDIRR